jgi:DNA-binding response OmpR family regulator
VHVLLVGDGCSLARTLQRAGHQVTVAASAAEARAHVEVGRVEVIVLGGVDAPVDSLRVFAELRRAELCPPVLLLVEQDGVQTRIAGLDAGADDCVARSCSSEEVLARLRALVRRAAAPGTPPSRQSR